MSAADRMVVRTGNGTYRSVPRRVGLGMIAAGRAAAAPAGSQPPTAMSPIYVPGVPGVDASARADVESPIPHDDEHQALVPNPYDLVNAAALAGEFDADDSAASADDAWDGSWQAERGPIVYNTPEPAPELQYVSDTGDEDVPTVEAVPLPPEPKPSARRSDWAEYADSLGVEVTSAMTKREIQDAAADAAQSLTNLPQPALTGGRLETPEDEPVTEESVTDDEDPGT